MAPRSRCAHALAKRCAVSRRMSLTWSRWMTNHAAAPAAATRRTPTRSGAPGRPGPPRRPRRRRRPGSIHATPVRRGGAEENIERRRRRRTPPVYRARPRDAPRPCQVDFPARSGSRRAVPEGVAFEVDHFEWIDDRLEVSGRWYGLRGHRFVRPALTVEVDDDGDERRRMLADLEHK